MEISKDKKIEPNKKTEKSVKVDSGAKKPVSASTSAKASADKKASAGKPAKKEVKVVTEVKARLRFLRISPRKVRVVVNELKGKTAAEALDYLRFVRKASVAPIAKLINSAIANAKNNFEIEKENLYIKVFTVNDGPILKRYKPRAHGRSARIAKRTSHIELILGVKKGSKSVTKTDKKQPKEEVKVVNPDEIKKSSPKIDGQGPEQKGQTEKGFLRKVFNRKTG